MADLKQVLIIDDEDTLLNTLTEALSDTYDIKTAKDGESGLKLALETHPNLVILDYKLPGMDGVEVLEKLRADDWGKLVPVFFATNSYEPELVNKVMLGGVKDYIIKSDISIDALKNQIAQHIS
jgi:response regulator RpfG family c-di-GMP phosphodiesterase